MSTEEYTFLKNSNKYYGVPPSQLRSKGESTKIEVALSEHRIKQLPNRNVKILRMIESTEELKLLYVKGK